MLVVVVLFVVFGLVVIANAKEIYSEYKLHEEKIV